MTSALLDLQEALVCGVDAHKSTHHAVVLNRLGVRLGDREFGTTAFAHQQMLEWMTEFGSISRVGVESTGTYAAGLTRHLRAEGVSVVEINTPHAHTRAHKGKDDAIDAEAAARKVLAGEAMSEPKDTTGAIESIRVLRVARDSAVKSRTVALTQLGDLLVTAPTALRESINAATNRGKASQCAKLRPDSARVGEPLHAAKFALRALARRIASFDAEITELDRHLERLVARAAPTLISKVGIGIGNAAQLLITAGQNIDRLTSEAAFARLCGVAPIPVSSGRTKRMRLHRGGDRQANRALYMIAICRLKYDPKTITYVERRLSEGLSKKDAIRCVKRFIAREVYNDLKHDLNTT